jgi:cytochrome P450
MLNAAEEALRWVCSVVYFARVVVRDAGVGGHLVRESNLW